ncbi:MAG: hypothetical protein ACN6NX_14745 [Acinetobacter sp.]
MIELSPTEIDLLEEFVEELAPRHVSSSPFITTLQAELVTALYKALDEKLAAVDGLPAAVRKSLKEVS